MRYVIIEDELPSYENLAAKLVLLEPDATVYPQIASVEEAITFFEQKIPYDLVFADIHLQDGNSLDVLSTAPVLAPIVFTTGHDNYLQDAFEYKAIDYLLKPVNIIKLKKTLEKFKDLKSLFQEINRHDGEPKERIIVKRGQDFQPLAVHDIVYLFTENKLVFAVDKEKKKYRCSDGNLADLAAQLDQAMFFRANRKYIINIRYLEKFHPDERSRIVVLMSIPPDEPLLVSQEHAGHFRKWIGQD